MAITTETLNTNFNYENINIYNRYSDGELVGYRVSPADGYVMYNTRDEYYEEDPETGDIIPVIYYRTIALLPKTYNFNNFAYVAVLRSEVDENYIFGVGDNDQSETM